MPHQFKILHLAGLVLVTMTGISAEVRYLTSRRALAQSFHPARFKGCDNRVESAGQQPTLLGKARADEAESTGCTG